jgi:hypothetical protein
MNPIFALNILDDVVHTLNSLDIPWCLDAGSVLGLHRERFSHDWLRHDTDHDIMLVGGIELAVKLKATFLSKGFQVLREYAKFSRPTQLCFQKDGIWVDFYFWFENPAEDGMLVTETEHGQLTSLKRFWDNRKQVSLGSSSYYVPGPSVEEYLQFRFGPDWRVPSKTKSPWEQQCPPLRKTPVRLALL